MTRKTSDPRTAPALLVTWQAPDRARYGPARSEDFGTRNQELDLPAQAVDGDGPAVP